MGAAAVAPGVVAQAAAAAKDYLRLADDAEGALLSRMAESAIGVAEAFCGQALLVRAHEDVLAVGGGWQALAAGPVVSIAGVTALPVAGAPSVLATGAYAVDIDPGGTGWVQVADAGGAGRVAVSYSAGLAATWEALPPPVAQGMAMLAAHLFDREDDRAPPAAVAALWRPWRRLRLQAERRR